MRVSASCNLNGTSVAFWGVYDRPWWSNRFSVMKGEEGEEPMPDAYDLEWGAIATWGRSHTGDWFEDSEEIKEFAPF